jgi:PAS domain-containing protein
MATAIECRYEALGQQSDALRVIFESLPWGVIVADRDGRLLFSNPAAERILGIGIVDGLPESCASLEGWYLPDQISIVPPDQLPLVRAIHGQEVCRRTYLCAQIWAQLSVLDSVDPSQRVASERPVGHGVGRSRNLS